MIKNKMEALKVEKKDPDGLRGNILANNKLPKPIATIDSLVSYFLILKILRRIPIIKPINSMPPIKPCSDKNSNK